MNATTNLRGAARGLPDHERRRRLETCRAASDLELLRAVVSTGVGGGEWRSVSDCAARALVVSDRRLRRWIAGDESPLELPAAMREKLEKLAFAFGVEILPATPAPTL